MFDPAYRRSPHLTRAIHDYFLAKCLDVVRPGGVVALITSHYSMDKKDSAVRRHLADGSVLLGALRLPNTAFKANAGTEVTTDILFLQKRSLDMQPTGETWTDLGTIGTEDGLIEINEYFARHPEMMLGRMEVGHGQYGLVPELIGSLEATILEEPSHVFPATFFGTEKVWGRFEAASEALLVSLNETGAINWPRMESLTARCAADLQDELGPLAYRNPEGGEWETADSYLSGNVRAKLVVARAAERFDCFATLRVLI